MNTKLYKPNSTGQAKKRYRIINDSETIKVGDWINDDSAGCAALDATGDKTLGFCTAIVTPDKRNLLSSSVTTDDYDGTWTSSSQTYAAAADNTTDKLIMAEYIPAREGDQFLVTLDAAKGTTTGSNKEGYYLAILTTDASLLDESTAATSQASTQFRIADPYNQGSTTQIVVEVIHRETSQYTQD